MKEEKVENEVKEVENIGVQEDIVEQASQQLDLNTILQELDQTREEHDNLCKEFNSLQEENERLKLDSDKQEKHETIIQ